MVQSQFTIEFLIGFGVDYGLMFAVGFAGAFVIDTYKTITKQNQKILLSRIFIAALFTGIITASIMPLIHSWKPNLPFQIYILFQFILGGLGFELIGYFTSFAKLGKAADNGLSSVYKKVLLVGKIRKVMKMEEESLNQALESVKANESSNAKVGINVEVTPTPSVSNTVAVSPEPTVQQESETDTTIQQEAIIPIEAASDGLSNYDKHGNI